jgi:hypothetical protein
MIVYRNGEFDLLAADVDRSEHDEDDEEYE